MTCPHCNTELEVCGSATFGLHDGTLFRCPKCRTEYATADNDGRLIEVKPLSIPKVKMSDISRSDQ